MTTDLNLAFVLHFLCFVHIRFEMLFILFIVRSVSFTVNVCFL